MRIRACFLVVLLTCGCASAGRCTSMQPPPSVGRLVAKSTDVLCLQIKRHSDEWLEGRVVGYIRALCECEGRCDEPRELLPEEVDELIEQIERRVAGDYDLAGEEADNVFDRMTCRCGKISIRNRDSLVARILGSMEAGEYSRVYYECLETRSLGIGRYLIVGLDRQAEGCNSVVGDINLSEWRARGEAGAMSVNNWEIAVALSNVASASLVGKVDSAIVDYLHRYRCEAFVRELREFILESGLYREIGRKGTRKLLGQLCEDDSARVKQALREMLEWATCKIPSAGVWMEEGEVCAFFRGVADDADARGLAAVRRSGLREMRRLARSRAERRVGMSLFEVGRRREERGTAYHRWRSQRVASDWLGPGVLDGGVMRFEQVVGSVVRSAEQDEFQGEDGERLSP